jgi:NodT family efflux transporter outer membrane factor (OMF) lipoprotein
MTRRLTAVLATLLLSACAGAGAYHAPDLPLAPAWSAANTDPIASRADWWHDFGDAALDRLIAAGLDGNADIAGALARLDQARAAAGGAHADRLPTGQTQDTLARQRQSIDSGLGRLVPYVPGLSRVQNQGDLGVSAGWDVDFAGGLAGREHAAQADAVAARAGLEATRLAIAAEIADAYLAWRTARADHALLLHQRQLIDQQLSVTGARVAHGDAARHDNDEAGATLAAIDAVLPNAEGAVASARNRIAILTGRPAGSDLPELDGIAETAALPVAGEPAAGTPADLLRHRPDLVLAEARLRASHARIGAALAEYWPKFSLSALFGFSSNDVSLLGANSANVITGAVGLRWRLFDFGRINAEVAGARGAEREALAAYRGNVLSAGGDVENAFITLTAARRALTAREMADATADHLLSQARARLRAGDASQIEIIAAEARRIDAARALLAAHADLASALVACHRALGG